MKKTIKILKSIIKEFLDKCCLKYDIVYKQRKDTMESIISTIEARQLALKVGVTSLPDLMVLEERNLCKIAKELKHTAKLFK